MSNLGQPNIDLTSLSSNSHTVNGKSLSSDDLMNSVSMISMKINSSNIDYVKKFTSEGLSKESRIKLIGQIKDKLGSDIFEFSTCNRILYVGFGTNCDELERCVLSIFNQKEALFDRYSGIEVWRHLVKVCSGLDSFIIGELQVMSQFRGSISLHRENNLIDEMNSSFFSHIISANRLLRKEFGFNQTTESMLNLASNAIEEVLSLEENPLCVVLGFGEMGRKAVDVLLSQGQQNIVVFSRNPEKSSQRDPELSSRITILSFDQWSVEEIKPSLIISTVRNIEPTFNSSNIIPNKNPVKIMDFSWPPSIDSTGISEGQELLGMEYWIKVAHKLGVEWDYESTIEKSEVLISNIENKFMSALSDRNQGIFRAFIYKTLEQLSNQWSDNRNSGEENLQLGAFSREIATWICNREGPFSSNELNEMILSTERKLNPSLLKIVASDVTEKIIHINAKSNLTEAAL
tara:strand:- start:9461 stop:10843 length:1383 start_codon:yes stop_codon:yes gene_type:complete